MLSVAALVFDADVGSISLGLIVTARFLLLRWCLMLMFTAFPSQQTAAARSAPRSSTPTKSGAFISNGVHDVTSAVNGSQFKAPANPSLPSGAVAMPTNVNGAGAAGKTGSRSGGLSGSGGGESVPRGQPATPSMIEG